MGTRAPVVAVAASGGHDSTALLHATLHAAAALGLRVVALHVHHGLLPEADGWLQHLERQCSRWQRAGWPVSLRSRRLSQVPARGDSIEAWARRERYAALAAMAREEGASLVLLAQHRQDQAETVLLQALRGAGLRGLSAMPALAQREGITWARPWLQQPPSAIDHYLRRHRLRPVQDPSNADPRYDRSRLRQQVWPVFEAAFPGAAERLGAVARHAQRAAEVVQGVVDADLAQVRAEAGGLRREVWMTLPAARRWLVLQAWAEARLPAGGVPDSLIERLCAELPQARSGARWPAGPGEGAALRLYRGLLDVVAASPVAPTPSLPACVPAIDGPGTQPLAAWHGRVELAPGGEGDLPRHLLPGAEWRPRQGGEQFQSHAAGLARSLKKQFQSAGVPVWLRDGPLLWHGGQLLWVPALGVDARVAAPAAVAALRLHWRRDGQGR